MHTNFKILFWFVVQNPVQNIIKIRPVNSQMQCDTKGPSNCTFIVCTNTDKHSN